MKVETMAKEVHDEIGKDIQGIHPWQYQNLNLVSINYEAILEDILTYWNQDARFREGFKVEGNNIYIPNFFEKVNGIHKNKNEYIEFIQNLKETKNTLVVDTYFDFDDYEILGIDKYYEFSMKCKYIEDKANTDLSNEEDNDKKAEIVKQRDRQLEEIRNKYFKKVDNN